MLHCDGNYFGSVNNLYFVTSQDWDLHTLRAVLLSGIAKLFVAAYTTRMRGGYLRFQAQYLRRIRLPRWSEVSGATREALVAAARAGEERACNEVAYLLYGLNRAERAALADDSADD